MDKSDFKVLVRRVPGYEPLVSLRFEMKQGYGEMHVGDKRRASPAAAGEVAEVSGDAARSGRFVHVLASGRRRQSYAFSRLDDDRLQRIPDDSWTELTPVTEFGIRYLDLPELGDAPSAAVVQVSANPAPARSSTPVPASASSTENSLLGRARSRARSVSPGAPERTSVQPAQPRAAAAMVNTRAGTPANEPRSSTASPPASRQATPSAGRSSTSGGAPPRGAVAGPAATGASPAAPRGISLESSLGRDAVAKLSTDELRARLLREMAKVEALHQAMAELQRRLDDSLARESDLVEVISRWSERG